MVYSLKFSYIYTMSFGLNCQLDTTQNHVGRVSVRDLDQVGLWACLWGIVLISGKTSSTVGVTIPWVVCVWEGELTTRTQALTALCSLP